MNRIIGAILILLVFQNTSFGQAQLSFEGGNGQPLSVNLSAPVSYFVTGSSAGNPPIFNFQGVGNLFANTPTRVFGSISFTINGGTPLAIQYLSSGYVGGDVQAADLFATGPFVGSASSVTPGQTVTLLPGTCFTVANFAAIAPANGSYQTFLSAGQGSAISGFGLTVPEPSTWATVAAMSSLFLVASRVRRATK